jgi:hypothetical protein
MFVETIHCDYIDLAAVSKTRTAHGGKRTSLFDAAGDLLGEVYGDFEDCVMDACPVIPASAGYETVRFWPAHQGEEQFVYRLPVIGWRMYRGVAVPITADDFDVEAAVLMPDGRVVERATGTWDTLDAWIAEKAKKANADAEREAAKVLHAAGTAGTTG